MPFCTNCGTKVEANASFCHNCGAAQRPTATSPTFDDMLSGISVRTAIILCYIPVFGVIPAIVFLAGQRFRTNYRVRFNAFQSLYLFVTWLILSSAIPTLFSSGFPGWPLEHLAFGLVKIAVIVCWVYLLFKASQEQQVRLPIIGDLAARSTHEQI
jgi:uncharacterized membrane protein